MTRRNVESPSTKRRSPWTKAVPRRSGALGTRASSSARRRRSNFRRFGQSAFVCRCKGGCASLPVRLRGLTASCAPAIWLSCASATHATATGWPRAIVLQQKTQRHVQFEITPSTREALEAWIKLAGLKLDRFLFPSRVHRSLHLGTRQYARIVHEWVEEIGLDLTAYGTHSMRRTKPTLIYRRDQERASCATAARP